MGGKGVIGARIGARIGKAAPGAVTFVGFDQAIFDEPSDTELVITSTPTGVIPGDSLLMIMVTDTSGGIPPDETLPVGWSSIASMHSENEVVVTVLRRVSGSEPVGSVDDQGDYTFPLVADAGLVSQSAVLLAYRNLRTTSDVISSGIVDVTASTSFACPSLTLTSSTDLYLGIVWVSDAALAVTPPGGTTERFDASQASDGISRRLEIFEFRKGSTGDTGTNTATIAAPHSGIAASILLKAAV